MSLVFIVKTLSLAALGFLLASMSWQSILLGTLCVFSYGFMTHIESFSEGYLAAFDSLVKVKKDD